MPDLFVHADADPKGYAVKAFGRGHHLASEDVLEWGVVEERPRTGPLRVANRRALIGLLTFRVTGCTPTGGRAASKSCTGQGMIAAAGDARCRAGGLPVLRVGDAGWCIGVGSTPSGQPVAVTCAVSVGRSCQSASAGVPSAGSRGAARAPGACSAAPVARHEFCLAIEWADGTPAAGARYTADGGGEQVSGRLDDDGEAVFDLPAERCEVRLPEYDVSLLVRSESSM